VRLFVKNKILEALIYFSKAFLTCFGCNYTTCSSYFWSYFRTPI